MADYVDDYLDGVATKSDSGTGTAHLIRAADVNAHTDALASLRTAVLTGKVHGLRSSASESVSLSGYVKTVSDAGVLMASQDGNGFERVIQRLSIERYAPSADGTGNDVAAINAATAAASDAGGAEVFLRNGVYRLQANVTMPENVTLVGESREGCILLIDHPDATTDGITFASNGSSYRTHSGLSNLTVKASSQSTCRDCVSINLWSGVKLKNVRIRNSGRYGILMGAVLDVTLEDVKTEHSKTSGLYVETQAGTISTTVRAERCYFSDTTEGAGVDAACNGVTFSKCIFESNGSTTRAAGVGARVRSGQAFFKGCYWENNAAWDLDAGTDSSSTAQVEIDGFTLVSGGYKQATYGGFRFDYCDAGKVSGGHIPAMDKSIVFRSHCAGVSVFGVSYVTTEPEWEGSGGVSKYPGLVVVSDASTGQYKLEGSFALRVGGGSQLQKVKSGSASYGGSGSVAAGATADATVTITGAVVGDSVMATSLGGDLETGFSVCAWVSAVNTVTFRFTNSSGGSSSVAARTLKATILGYA